MEPTVGAAGGVFITLEGPDGAGKSSQARLLGESLRAAGLTVVVTREPGGTELGERIRRLLLEAGGPARDPLAEATLFNAARRQLVGEIIRPALAGAGWVICDRFADSTLAYQGYGAGLPLDRLRTLAEIATDGLVPDRTLLLDLPVEEGLARRAGGASAELTRFELADDHDVAFHRRVREGYLALAAEAPERWRIVDARAKPGAVAEAVLDALDDVLPRRELAAG